MSDERESNPEANPYEAPSAELAVPVAGERIGGSIDKTLAGEAELGFGDTFSEAWALVKGSKTVLLGGLILLYIVLFVAIAILASVLGVDQTQNPLVSTLLQLVIGVLLYPAFAGVMMVCFRRIAGIPIAFGQLFEHYSSFGSIAAMGVIISVASLIGMMLFVLPGVYISIATALAIPLHVEKKLGIVDSITTSIKLINKKFFTVLGLYLVIGIAFGLSILTIVGWIWIVPWGVLAMAVIYKQLAGIDPANLG